VLVVDDDSRFRDLAVAVLRAGGFRVCGAADTVAGALTAVLDLQPAAVLVDARLPDGDGIVLAQQMLALPWAPRVLLTSSDAEVAAEVARVAARGRAVPFVPKSELPDAPLDLLLGRPGDAG
jgi:CheY-like chemotaxis protein